MNKIIDFTRNFHPSKLGLGLWDMLLIVCFILAGLILIKWLVSFCSPQTATLARTVFKWTMITFACFVALFILLNAVLTGDYGNVFVAFILILASKIDHWYKLYDNFVDRRINRDS